MPSTIDRTQSHALCTHNQLEINSITITSNSSNRAQSSSFQHVIVTIFEQWILSFRIPRVSLSLSSLSRSLGRRYYFVVTMYHLRSHTPTHMHRHTVRFSRHFPLAAKPQLFFLFPNRIVVLVEEMFLFFVSFRIVFTSPRALYKCQFVRSLSPNYSADAAKYCS